jgi:hypothetical protein
VRKRSIRERRRRQAMNYNDRKSYKRLPPKEKEAIDKAIVEFIEKQVNHEEAELQKIWIQLACIILHETFGMGQKRILLFIGNWKRIYKRNMKLGSKEAQDEFLKAEMDKIFGKDGYPYDFIDSLEKRG